MKKQTQQELYYKRKNEARELRSEILKGTGLGLLILGGLAIIIFGLIGGLGFFFYFEEFKHLQNSVENLKQVKEVPKVDISSNIIWYPSSINWTIITNRY